MTTNLDIPQEQRFFGPDDVGCHADDTFGHQHVRNTLAALIETLDGGLGNEDAQALQESLEATMPGTRSRRWISSSRTPPTTSRGNWRVG